MTTIARTAFLALGAVLVLALASCAGTNQARGQRTASGEATPREEMESLKRALDAAYERERALAARLAKVEESYGRLREELAKLSAPATGSKGGFDSGKAVRLPNLAGGQDTLIEDESEVHAIYRRGRDAYRERRYDDAVKQFDKILNMAPYSEWADNAQYWKGECYYGMGKYGQGLIEFAKIFAFSRTEKADDAQLKIARCHLALGERQKALEAFRKLVEEYPESEYASTARGEIGNLQGP